jgi:protein-disulfide isomerase
MIRKFLFGAFLACLMVAVPVQAQPLPRQSQSGQQSEQAKTITGKVTSVAAGGKGFSMEVNQGNSKRTMQFVLDKNAVVQGHVGTGTTATVQYQETGGQFVATNIIEQTTPAKSQ